MVLAWDVFTWSPVSCACPCCVVFCLLSFTLEASFAGANFGKHKDLQFTSDMFADIGSVFCDALLDYCDPDQSKVRCGVCECAAVCVLCS